MTETAQPVAQRPVPTEDAPDHGQICHMRYNVVLCDTVYWVDEGIHVVRAEDFDLLAVGHDRLEAVQRLVEEAYSLFEALGELVDSDEITEAERALFVRIGEPFVEAHRLNEKRRRALLIDFPRLRRRGAHMRDWGSGSSLANSKRPSIA